MQYEKPYLDKKTNEWVLRIWREDEIIGRWVQTIRFEHPKSVDKYIELLTQKGR